MIGNEASRRASSHDDLFSLQQEIRISRGSFSSMASGSMAPPTDNLLHPVEPQLPPEHLSFEARGRYPSSNSIQGHRTREMASFASADPTKLWGPMEAMMINPNSQRSRANSQDAGAPHFSEKFLLEDPKNSTPNVSFISADSENAELSKIMASQHFTNAEAKSNTLEIPFTSRKPAVYANQSNGNVNSNWMSRTQYAQPPPGALKKSASMASLPFVERSYEMNTSISNVSHQRSSDFNHRSVVSAPDVGSNAGAPICRYFLQGYCSRGAHCFYSHNTKSSLPPHQNQQSITLSAPSHAVPLSAHIRNLSVPVGSSLLRPSSVVLPSFDHHNSPHSQFLNPNPMDPRFPTKALTPAAKKSTADEEANRYLNVNIEDLVGQYYPMCKDQYGCRYLQKQIEESPEKALSYVFQDIFDHLAELMTDPFGNYLCQKLFEFCDDSQKGMIVARVAPNLVAISLNMHGTRAVQKLIENITDQKQVKAVTIAFSTDAVKLIKDLNGNHVIQKCLSKLSSSMNQFVFDAVSATIIEVATHRHGCCVLQRCIDHAVDSQKLQLVQEIAANGLALVQDPFGNYVVQYVLDLEDESYSSYIVSPFIGNVCLLSVQKFSSNVIEKCIRVSNASLRRQLIEELLDRQRLESLLRDSYANYVVQTALDYADADQRQMLIDCIKPILPVIRTTPYGKRLQTKLARSSEI